MANRVICWFEGTKLEIGGCLGRVSQLPHTCRVIHLIRCYRTARSIEELFVRLMLSRLTSWHEVEKLGIGGEAGIRTLGTGLSPYNGLANRRLQPLGHLTADAKCTCRSGLQRSTFYTRGQRRSPGA